ncbi:MAG: hypothetical protein ACOYKM_08090 [Caulobacterales bacterium]
MTWIALFGSAWAFLSVFDHLIPGLIRFSIIAKGLTAAYRAGRDWVWDQVQWAFAFIQIRIPELPPYWLDALAIAGLVLAALNFESIHRFGRSLVLDFGRHILGYVARMIGGERHDRATLFAWRIGRHWASAAFLYLGFWILGFAVRAGLEALGLEVPLLFPPSWMWIQPGLEAFYLGLFFLLSCVIIDRWKGDPQSAPRGSIKAVARFAVDTLCFVPTIFVLVMSAFVNGWRSLALALALVAALIGANAAAVHYIDPTLQRPPQWLCALVNADPQAAPEPRCKPV